MSSGDVIVLNEGLTASQTKSGKQRFHVTIKTQPVIINASPKALGKEVADAIAHHLRERIKGITATASAATLRARDAARRALLKGEQWAVRRYAGGRTGTTIPAQSDRMFNDSGRFADSIVARAARDGTWRVNVAANRLDPQTAQGGVAGVERIWQRLVQLIPEFADMGKLMQESDIVRARVRAAEKMVKVANSSWEKAKAIAEFVKDTYETVDAAASG